jgi:dTDP-3-amino-2,3,6-trideoxy-4-keto-D-glucose/dTDP-3-amino-3,4,6-trideoxy-alpha-D-glucose/dTDP-2,6-dideoxy-D-kanosamine transaminase
LSTTTLIPLNDLRRGVSGDEALAEAVERVVRSGWYLHGEEAASFESELATYLGARHVIGVASGTDALALAFSALGGGPGKEILTAANAGGYSALAARACGMGVRYADVDDRDLLLTSESVQRALTPATTIVVVTHLYGKMAPVAAIGELCRARGVALVEDCAQAAGARAGARHAGSFGDAAAFSFYPTKNLGALGDGGAVVTCDEEVALRVRSLAQYGWGAKYRVEQDGGRNSRLDEIQAAVLRVRLPRLDELNARRREVVARYAHTLDATGVRMAQRGEEDYVAHLAVARTPWRSELKQGLHARGIRTDIHYPIPDHHQRFIGSASVELPVTERASAEVLSLPCFPEIEDEELEQVCSALGAVTESL